MTYMTTVTNLSIPEMEFVCIMVWYLELDTHAEIGGAQAIHEQEKANHFN